MKNLTFLIIVIFFSTIVYGVNNQAISNGNWTASSTWSMGHSPVSGETVIIPSGKTVTITNVQTYISSLTLEIYGSLLLNGGSLKLSNGSFIYIYSGGEILGMGNNTELVTIAGTQKYSGNSQTPVTGPQMANSSLFPGFTPFAPLPLQFLSFSLAHGNNCIMVQWVTAQEQNTSYFDIERSTDGSIWNSIGHVTANGNSSSSSTYYYCDKNLISENAYYRIKQVDQDGQFTYTAIKNIKIAGSPMGNVQIAAANHTLILQFPQAIHGQVVVRIVSFNGQVVNTHSVSNPLGQVVFIANSFLNGAYIISVGNGNDINTARQVIF